MNKAPNTGLHGYNQIINFYLIHRCGLTQRLAESFGTQIFYIYRLQNLKGKDLVHLNLIAQLKGIEGTLSIPRYNSFGSFILNLASRLIQKKIYTKYSQI